MIRKLAITVFAFLIALPAFPETRKPSTGQESSALHLMNNSEFTLFLARLNTAVLGWEAQLRSVDVKSLGLDSDDRGELEKGYSLCLQSLASTREEIQKLSEKQTLRIDLLLLVDLNDLARSLDGLDRDLANAVTAPGNGTAQKSLSYVREVLGIDAALALHTAEFQNHVFAFAKVIDAQLEQSEKEPGEPPAQE
jgi:hypothetical protein